MAESDPTPTLRVFHIQGPTVSAVLPQPSAVAPQSPKDPIRAAWQQLLTTGTIGLPAPGTSVRATSVRATSAQSRAAAQCAPSISLPASALADKAIGYDFRFPEHASPPPRLGAFALPSWISAASVEGPRLVFFTLTDETGGATYGVSLQLVDALSPETDHPPPVHPSAAHAAEAAGAAEAAAAVGGAAGGLHDGDGGGAPVRCAPAPGAPAPGAPASAAPPPDAAVGPDAESVHSPLHPPPPVQPPPHSPPHSPPHPQPHSPRRSLRLG